MEENIITEDEIQEIINKMQEFSAKTQELSGQKNRTNTKWPFLQELILDGEQHPNNTEEKFNNDYLDKILFIYEVHVFTNIQPPVKILKDLIENKEKNEKFVNQYHQALTRYVTNHYEGEARPFLEGHFSLETQLEYFKDKGYVNLLAF